MMGEFATWIIMVCVAFFIAPALCDIAKSLKKIAENEQTNRH